MLLAAFAASAAPAGAVTLPAGFTDEVVTTVAAPTAFAFTPDGRMLITTQPGRLRVFGGGTLVATPALDLATRTCSESERGMLGVAVDPSFAANGFVYVFYTFRTTSGTCVNRVSRFTMSANTINPATELVLVDNMPSPAGNHNAGDVQFGRDGNLYISIGDGGCDYAGGGCAGSNDAARDQNVLTGKILRITSTGGIPATNPFQGADSARCAVTGRTTAAKCQETFAWGLRNPFRMAFDPNDPGTRFHINDVGQNVWEEIDLGTAGADYGWNLREGHCANGSTTNCGAPPAGMTNPIHDYDHASTGCASITGGAFVPNGVWPAAYDGRYLFADYVCGRIFLLTASGTGFTRSIFADALGPSSAVHLGFGPHGATRALYYTSYASGGSVHRISYAAANRAPTAVLTADPTSGAPGVNVTLNGSGSSDPDAGDALTYLWDFGDGSAPTQTSTSSTTHTYSAAGTFTATLTVRDNHGATSNQASATIDVGNTPPMPVITSPAAGQRFAVDEVIALRGSASDAEQGALPDSALSWSVVRHHDTHTHPWAGPIGGNAGSFTGAAPEDLFATSNSHLEVRLTATDAHGASATVARVVQPKLVNLTFASSPTGRTLQLDGTSFTTPRTWVSWQGWDVTVNAPDQKPWNFASWSDGGARSHVIDTPATATTYTATYRKGGKR